MVTNKENNGNDNLKEPNMVTILSYLVPCQVEGIRDSLYTTYQY